jgi:hypothetical protein
MRDKDEIISKLRVRRVFSFSSVASESLTVNEMALLIKGCSPGFFNGSPSLRKNVSLGVFELCSASSVNPTSPDLRVPYEILFDAAAENGLLPVCYELMRHIGSEDLSQACRRASSDFLPLLTELCESSEYNTTFALGLKKELSSMNVQVIRRDIGLDLFHPIGFKFVAVGPELTTAA